MSKEFKGQVNLYANQPQDSKEGATRRIGFNLSGPIIQDTLGFRIYGNLNKTEPDAADINTGHGNDSAAGVEGVRNKDIAGRLQWKISPAQTLILDSSYSRQGNIYNGDTQNSNPPAPDKVALYNGLVNSKAETARLYRSAFSLTHDGAWEWGDTKNVISYERTVNSHLPEGLAGGPEGSYTGLDFVQSRLKNLRFSSEANIPFKLGVDNVLTVGAEFIDSKLDDPTSNSQSLTDTIPGGPGRKPRKVVNIFSGVSEHRSGKTSQRNWAAYVEDNISLTDKTHLIPAIRFDHNSASGSNWSPALNFSHQIGENWLVKGGIARAYKAPNLYQASSDFLLYTRGQGCPLNPSGSFSCFYMGNGNLKPETGINKEIGLEFNKNGWQASATYFHNAYRNKIVIGENIIATSDIGNWLLQWENTPKATISGIEGNLVIPLHDTLKWSNNFTYMHKSEDYQGNPLSLVPKHTINSTLSWTPNERFDANLTFTHYGRTKPRGVAINRLERDGNPRAGITPLTSEHNQTQVGSYGIWGINAGYNWNKRVAVRGGISNLFDKKLYRTTAGAQTYNEHGRAFYGSLKVSF